MVDEVEIHLTLVSQGHLQEVLVRFHHLMVWVAQGFPPGDVNENRSGWVELMLPVLHRRLARGGPLVTGSEFPPG